MAEAQTTGNDDFDAMFDEAITAAEAPAKTPEELAAEQKAADDAATKADADAAAAEGKTPEELAAEKEAADAAAKKAGEDAAAKKAEEDAAAKKAAEDAASGKTPEELAAEKEAADAAAKKAEEDATAKKAADEAAAKAAASKKAADETPAAETAEEKAAREKREADTKAALEPYAPTEDEQKAITAWEKDFPTESVAVRSLVKQLDREITRRVYNGVNAVLQQVYKDFSPIAAGYTQDAETRHFQQIRAAHSDYDTLEPELHTWVETQPKYLQPAMKQTLESGSAEDVIDLVKRYKDASGKPAAPAAPAAPAKPAAPAADPAALAAVPSRRSAPAPKGGVAKDDFDGAFDDATGKK